MRSQNRLRMLWAVALAAGFAITLSVVSKSPAQQSDDGESQIQRGLAISPVDLNMEGKRRSLVGLGSYIVNAQSACSDCHTNPLYLPGGNPFFGQPTQVNVQQFLAGGVQFGPFTSRNITPEPPSNLPAGLTLDQFVEVMRTGRDFDNMHPQFGPLLQVMPWPGYKNMTDDDLQAIYEYLRAIPHAEPAP